MTARFLHDDPLRNHPGALGQAPPPTNATVDSVGRVDDDGDWQDIELNPASGTAQAGES